MSQRTNQEYRKSDLNQLSDQTNGCLGLEIDCHLKWHKHVTELTKIFSQKLSLLRSLYFLPVKARLDFYFKVILPSVLYVLIIWGSCNKTLFNTLERIHIRAAKLIHGLDWNLPSVDVLARVNWTPIKEFYERGILNFVHKCYYGHAPIPPRAFSQSESVNYTILEKHNA